MAGKDQTTGSSPFSFRPSDASVPGQADSVADGHRAGSDPFGSVSGSGAGDNPLFSAPAKGADDPGVAYGYRRSLRGHRDEVSVYTAQMDARHALDRRNAVLIVAGVLVLLLIPVLTVLPIGLFGSGAPALTPAYLIDSLGSNITGLANWMTGGPVTSGVSVLFWQTIAAAVVGAALALNGCVFQGALKNALAAPSTLGVMSGGTLGTLIYTLAFGVPASVAAANEAVKASELEAELAAMDWPSYLFATQGRALCSMAGCFIIVALVLLIAHIAGRGKVSKVALLIAGQVFAALITGVIAIIRQYLMYYGTVEQQEAIQSILGGSISTIVDGPDLLILAVPLVIGAIVIMLMRNRLNLLAFNDDEAKSMGINTLATRNFAIIVCTILTGVAVSFVGSVGFVGFLVPHLARKAVGPNLRYLVPASLLFGAIFLMLANYLMNLTSIFSGSLGTLTSLVGILFFLGMAVRERARGNVDWI